jgi:hypothetical protein
MVLSLITPESTEFRQVKLERVSPSIYVDASKRSDRIDKSHVSIIRPQSSRRSRSRDESEESHVVAGLLPLYQHLESIIATR